MTKPAICYYLIFPDGYYGKAAGAESSARAILNARFGSDTEVEVEATSLEAGPITEIRAYLLLYDFGDGPPTAAQVACAQELQCVTNNAFFGKKVQFAIAKAESNSEALSTA